MEHEVKVKITEKDYFAFQKEYLMRSKIVMICFVCFLFTIGQGVYNDKTDIVSLILNNVIPVTIILIVFLPIYRFQLKRSYKSDKILQEEQTLLLKEDGIHHSMQRGNFNYTVEDFSRVIFGQKIIAIFVSKQKALLLPRHCFSSKEEEQAVEAFIKAHYVKDKKKQK